MDYPRRELLAHVAHRQNLCLNTMRQTKAVAWHHAVVSDCPTPAVYVEIKDGSNVFPLYLYPEEQRGQQQSLVTEHAWQTGEGGRVPNLSPDFVEEVEHRFGLKFLSDGRGDLTKSFGPEDVFAYIYAVLSCPSYQSRYCDFLKLDFPRIPLVTQQAQFLDFANLGTKLMQAHLMTTDGDPLIHVSFPITGDNIVARNAPRFTDIDPSSGNYLEQSRVYINESQYFENVPLDVWESELGGYQVCLQWLKDRRELGLSYSELTHYQRLVASMYESLRIIDEIESVAPNWTV